MKSKIWYINSFVVVVVFFFSEFSQSFGKKLVNFGQIKIWPEIREIGIQMGHSFLENRGFSRDVIAAKSAKSRCSHRPCWISQNMA